MSQQGFGVVWVVASLSWFICYWVIGFFVHVVQNTVDASFICYMIDVDAGKCRRSEAHRVFEGSIR